MLNMIELHALAGNVVDELLQGIEDLVIQISSLSMTDYWHQRLSERTWFQLQCQNQWAQRSRHGPRIGHSRCSHRHPKIRWCLGELAQAKKKITQDQNCLIISLHWTEQKNSWGSQLAQRTIARTIWGPRCWVQRRYCRCWWGMAILNVNQKAISLLASLTNPSLI